MIVKQIIDEDFVNYKKPAMFIAFPICDFKCEFVSSASCQNRSLSELPDIEIPAEDLISRYLSNPITSSIVISGLEPFCTLSQLVEFVQVLRVKFRCDDDIVIYTGYNEWEVKDKIAIHLSKFSNIVVKFGRFMPEFEEVFDEVLGVKLASSNQYAKVLKPYELKIFTNPNKEFVTSFGNKLVETGGYCPCQLFREEATKCMCRSFRESSFEGNCHCGLYYKEWREVPV